MKRLAYRFILPMIVVALLGLALPVSHVLADDPIEIYWDFRTAQHDTTGIPFDGDLGLVAGACPIEQSDWPSFVWGSGDGWVAQGYAWDPGDCGAYMGGMQFPNDDALIHPGVIEFRIYFDNGIPQHNLNVIADGFEISPSFAAPCGEFADTPCARGSYVFAYAAGITDLRNLTIAGLSTNSQFHVAGMSIVYDPDGDDPGLGDLTMPLKSDDLHPEWGMYDPAYVHELDEDWPDDEGREPVYAYSDSLFASVHTVKAGTVTAVDPDITSQCETLDEVGVPFAPHACYLVVPAVIAGEAISQLFALQMTNTALVLVKDDEDENTIYTYFVSNPKVAVGDHLEPGCILGETITLNNSPVSIGDIGVGGSVGNGGVSGTVQTTVGLNTIQTGESVTVVRMDNLEPEVTRLYPALTSEPDETACSGNFGGCVNANSSLLSFQSWSHTESVTLLDGGGVSLPTSSQIYQTGLEVDEATTYTLNVQARSSNAGNGFDVVPRIRLFAGTQISEQPITTAWVNYSFDFLGEDLQPEQGFGVVNQTLTGTNIEIRYICLSEQGTGQVTSACYFKNHHFDDGPANWTITDGVTFQAGQAYTYDDSIVEQGAILNPISGDEEADYTLKIVGRLIATNAYTGQIGKSVTIQYRYPTGGTYTDVGEIDAALVDTEGKRLLDGSVNLEHAYTLTTTFSISTFTTGLFSFKTLVDDSDGYLKGFRIDYACLQSNTDDGSFPGQGGAGFDPPFYENCAVVTTPEDNNISSWTYYHWSNLKRFFDCTLMVKLNSMAQLMDNAWKTTRLFFRWVIATSQMSGRWLSAQVFPWLNGQFRNMAYGQVTTVYQEGGGTCNDLFCVLNSLITGILTPVTSIVNTLLSLLTVGVNLLLTVITGIIGLALGFLTRLLGLFNQATGLLGGILNAYNTATPVAVDGLPMCNVDPNSSLFCRGTWLLDNTILSGRWGVLFTLIIGVAGVHLILWVIGEFKSAIVTTGSGS